MIARTMKFLIVLTGLLVISSYLYAQDDQIPVRDDHTIKPPAADLTHFMDFGIGLGLDYGGILGVQIGVAPIKHLTFFAAFGYDLIQVGWQVGIKGLILPKTTKNTFRPFLKAMYGCNSVIVIDGFSEYDKVYKGFTVGAGLELRFGKKKQNGFDLDLNVPLRTPDFWEDYNRIQNDPNIAVTMGPQPIAFSVGFHHEF
jgi:hypothetical protein